MCLCCRTAVPVAQELEAGCSGWVQFNINRGTQPHRDVSGGFDQCFTLAHGIRELQAPSEFQCLPPLQPVSQEAAFDVTVGKPLSALLPPVELAREEGWVTCSWVEKPYVAPRRSSPFMSSVDADASTTCSDDAPSQSSPSCDADVNGAIGESISDDTVDTPLEETGEAEKELQVKVVAQLQEMNVKGILRLFSETNLVPDLCQVWWRVGSRSSEGFQRGEALGVSIQSLDVDDLSASVVDARVPDVDFLKSHQQKSLRWMAMREQEAELFVADWHTTQKLEWQFRTGALSAPRLKSSDELFKPKEIAKGPSMVCLGRGPVELQLEYRMENAYDIRGGVLADPVGSGKTATCLSHIACMHGSPAPKPTRSTTWRQEYLLHLDATLVLCPDTVHHQWLVEVEKWPQLAAVIKTLCISSVDDLLTTPLKGSTKKKAKVIIAPYSLLAQKEYCEKLASPLTSAKWKQLTHSFKQKVQKQDGLCGVALEGYCWRRVILDEFHELANGAQFRSARKVLRFLQSSARWGVTGTPEELLRSTGDAQRAAGIFQCQLNAVRSARRFCEHYYRSSRAELDVQVEERVVKVEHSGHERALYLQMSRDLDCRVEDLGPQPWDSKKLASLRQLLQLCSHFAVADTSPTEVKQAASGLEAARALHCHKREVATKALQAVESEAFRHERDAMGAEDVRENVKGGGGRKRQGERSDDVAKQARYAGEALSKLHQASMGALRSFTFFDSVWRLVANGFSCQEASRCVICFEDFSGHEALLRCGHVFCSDCVNQALTLGRHVCPLCREPFDRRGVIDVRLLQQEQSPVQKPGLANTKSSVEARKFGSKLQRIVQALEEVQAESPDAKVIVFTQWRRLEERIGNAFSELDISHLRLSACKDLFETRRVLEHFQDPANNDARVLFLSLDAHASGTNLTAASHVFLVHPMLAATAEQQAAYERQAIGRAARLGQRGKVTVWRFVTSGTVEEELIRSENPRQ